MEQDRLLLESRELITSILQAIMSFRFDSSNGGGRNSPNRCTLKKIPPAASEGSSLDAAEEGGVDWGHHHGQQQQQQNRIAVSHGPGCDSCNVCSSRRVSTSSEACVPLSKALTDYIHDSREAWKVINKLLEQLEEAERYYPTQKALQVDYPQYGSVEFNDRVQAMCLWLNITNDLSMTFELTELALGVADLDGVWWPCIGSHSGGQHTCINDEDDENYDMTSGGFIGHGKQEVLRPAALRLDASGNVEEIGGNRDSNSVSSSGGDDDFSSVKDNSSDTSAGGEPRPMGRPRKSSIRTPSSSDELSDFSRSSTARRLDLGDSSPGLGQSVDSSMEYGSSRPPPPTRQKSVTFDIGDVLPIPEDDIGDDDSFLDDDASSTGTGSMSTSTPNRSRSPRSATQDSPRLGRIFSACHFSFDYDSSTALYRPFVDRSLKHLGLRKMTVQMYRLLGPTLDKAKSALMNPDDMKMEVQAGKGHQRYLIKVNVMLSSKMSLN